jgi:hypothetical protein
MVAAWFRLTGIVPVNGWVFIDTVDTGWYMNQQFSVHRACFQYMHRMAAVFGQSISQYTACRPGTQY